mmetsp:Transcript_10546/g.29803  ORF Transcript_10546/g.29803 Transcript_10546/m.29803 type:complete len:568 (+) Transcript_10546:36-1739(+)
MLFFRWRLFIIIISVLCVSCPLLRLFAKKLPSWLIQTNDLPPHATHDAPDEQVGDSHDASDLEGGGHVVVARSVEDGRLPAGVVGHSAEQVGVEGDRQGRQEWRGSGADHRGQESRAQSGELRGLGGEQVVQQEVRDVEGDEHGRPAEVHGGEAGVHLGGQGPDQAELLELGGHGDQDSEPDERVPGTLLLQEVVPRQHPSDHLQSDSDHRRGGPRDAELVSKDPQDHGEHHGSGDHPLDLLHGAQLLELLGRGLWGVRRLLDLRRHDLVDDQRRQEQPSEPGNDPGLEPSDPRVGHRVAQVGGEHESQGVLRRPREGDAREVGGRLQLGLGQERPQLVRSLSRQGSRLLGQRHDDREVDAAAPGGGARHGGAENALAHRQAVAEPEGALAEQLDKVGGHPVSQARLHEALGEEERVHNQPDDVQAEGGEGRLEGEGFGSYRRGHPREGPRPDGERPDHEPSDRGDEYRQKLPRLLGDPVGPRDEEVYDNPQGHGHHEGHDLHRRQLRLGDRAAVPVRGHLRGRPHLQAALPSGLDDDPGGPDGDATPRVPPGLPPQLQSPLPPPQA